MSEILSVGSYSLIAGGHFVEESRIRISFQQLHHQVVYIGMAVELDSSLKVGK